MPEMRITMTAAETIQAGMLLQAHVTKNAEGLWTYASDWDDAKIAATVGRIQEGQTNDALAAALGMRGAK